MTYSISVRGASIAAALVALAVKFDEDVVKPQPIHARDRDAALAAAKATADHLGEQPEGMETSISLSGSLGWSGMLDTPEMKITASSVSASVYFTHPPAPKPA